MTQKGASDVRDHLRQHIDASDGLIVMQISGDWATSGIDRKVTDWMKQNLA